MQIFLIFQNYSLDTTQKNNYLAKIEIIQAPVLSPAYSPSVGGAWILYFTVPRLGNYPCSLFFVWFGAGTPAL